MTGYDRPWASGNDETWFWPATTIAHREAVVASTDAGRGPRGRRLPPWSVASSIVADGLVVLSSVSASSRMVLTRIRLGRKNWRVGVNSQTDLFCDIARLTVSIDRAAAATEMALSERLPMSGDGDPRSPLVEHKELCRQLAALRDRVARAQHGSEEPRALRAELATLVCFAETLQADADIWHGALKQRIREFEQQRAAERQERERLAAQRAQLVRRRDALEFAIGETAGRMALQNGGECRRTLPVFALGDGLTVCSVSVSCPRRGVRFAKRWLVTLNGSRDDVLVRRD